MAGRCLKGVWRESMGCPNGILESQDRSSQGYLAFSVSNLLEVVSEMRLWSTQYHTFLVALLTHNH